MGPAEFERLVREQLRARDRQRRARLMDQANYEAADAAFVDAVMTAAGYGGLDGAEKTARKARRARRDNEDAAFGEA